MRIDYEAWRFWISIAQTLVTVAIAIYVWLVNKGRVTNKRISDLDAKMDDLKKEQELKCTKHHERTATLEIDIKQVPSKVEITNLTTKIDRLSEKLATADGRLIGINRAVDLLNQHHLRVPE